MFDSFQGSKKDLKAKSRYSKGANSIAEHIVGAKAQLVKCSSEIVV